LRIEANSGDLPSKESIANGMGVDGDPFRHGIYPSRD
jgi:hypothetical protein